MIIGSSYDLECYDKYINKETGEVVYADSFFSDESCMYSEREDFFFLKRVYLPYTRTYTDINRDVYQTDTTILLLECDYCGEHFESTEKARMEKESSFRGSCKRAGYEIKDGEKYIYKDNCEDCLENKKRETTMLTHGYWHPFSTNEHRIKMAQIKKEVNNVPTSRGQRYIAKMFNAELNVLVDYYFADMILDDKIVIEYDGGGHNLSVLMGNMTQDEFDARESKRSGYLFSKGYKIVRFISPEELFPECEKTTKEIICNAIAELYLSDLNEIHITMSDRVNDPVYGKLKPIKSILEDSEWGEELL